MQAGATPLRRHVRCWRLGQRQRPQGRVARPETRVRSSWHRTPHTPTHAARVMTHTHTHIRTPSVLFSVSRSVLVWPVAWPAESRDYVEEKMHARLVQSLHARSLARLTVTLRARTPAEMWAEWLNVCWSWLLEARTSCAWASTWPMHDGRQLAYSCFIYLPIPGLLLSSRLRFDLGDGRARVVPCAWNGAKWLRWSMDGVAAARDLPSPEDKRKHAARFCFLNLYHESSGSRLGCLSFDLSISRIRVFYIDSSVFVTVPQRRGSRGYNYTPMISTLPRWWCLQLVIE